MGTLCKSGRLYKFKTNKHKTDSFNKMNIIYNDADEDLNVLNVILQKNYQDIFALLHSSKLHFTQKIKPLQSKIAQVYRKHSTPSIGGQYY